MMRVVLGVIACVAVFAAAGGEEPVARAQAFVPMYVTGKITTKPMDTEHYYLTSAKFLAHLTPPGTNVDRSSTPVNMTFGFHGESTTAWGWSVEDANWKAKGSKHKFKGSGIAVKADLATGVFKVAIKKLAYHTEAGPGNPIRFVFWPVPASYAAEDVWTPVPRKEGCFFYER